MQIGQYAIAVVLTVIGVARAIADGTSVLAAVVAGLAVLAWHAAGALLPTTSARRTVVWWLVGLAVAWGGAVAVSAEFVWLAFLLWLLAGHLLPGWWAIGFSALIYAVVAIAPLLHHGTTSYANMLGPLIGGIFALGISRGYLQLLNDAAERERLVETLTRARHETELLQDELALTQRQAGAIGERARIARDTHDTVAQGLSSIRLIAHAGAGSAASHVDAGQEHALTRIELIAGESLADVRRIIAALTPAELEDGALEGALARLLERFTQENNAVFGRATPIQVALHVDPATPQLAVEIEVALLRVAQSALANVRQHAAASRADVTLSVTGGQVRLDVSDDGAGFSVDDWEASGSPAAAGRTSFGLRMMRERLRDLGGGLDIESAPGEGCVISAHLPIVAGAGAGAAPARQASPNPPETTEETQ